MLCCKLAHKSSPFPPKTYPLSSPFPPKTFPLSPSSLILQEDPASAASRLQWLSPANNGTFGKVASFAKVASEVVAFDVFDRVVVQLQHFSLPQACERRWPKTPPLSTSGCVCEFLPKE